ncbi:endoplasmic reticulum aminopeptidase 1-like isoform X2 [Daphnia pulex]|uniref:Aminopeptidase n=1 Tax=Daphnia pulex TaxID=6669 RepID=E9GIY2_DAPPU|nr:endoplasmic reticulum aminopeptidase 1-like isoform X2 [Daphnia pulex]EFX80575.1 hypothetical protein DAPPUDRAFT_318470 [Daphnia pulex]|eukprot:EFX80575.1 hypothetical protein DAPPUDRAFT_318470 [Daphnia pulex]
MDSSARRRPDRNAGPNAYHEDEVTVLTGPSKSAGIEDGKINYEKGEFYTNPPVATCSRRQAVVIIGLILVTLLTCSLIIAFVRPSHCGHVDEGGLDFHEEVAVTAPPEAIATNGEPFPWNDVRLPDSIVPLRYSVVLHPNLTTLFLRGQMEVVFAVQKETNFIVFHGKDVTLTVVMVKDKNMREILTTRTLYYPYHQQIYIELKNYLLPGNNYSLALRYEGMVRTDLEGLYLSSYKAPSGMKRYLVTTHFQPTSARSAFPCWDEPNFKARFKIGAVRQRNYVALSNMPLDNTEDVSIFWGSGLVQDNFHESVAMSTYLVALVVSDYGRIQEVTKTGVTLSIYAPPHMTNQAEFALKAAVKLFDYFQSFFGFSYPLPKLDLISMPDFAAGAMENWGLAVFRESALLMDNNTTSSSAKQRVVLIIAHELAHQWFGNLVTMKWWDDLWLSEGFASFAEYIGVHHIFPEWAMMDQFIHSKTMPALRTDALSTSHPVSVTVADPIEIEAIFDTISYNKGASILYMLQRVLGEEIMRRGLMLYLERHQYGNANMDDLWHALSLGTLNSSHPVPVKDMMDTWTHQLGYPLVTLRRHGNMIHASQKHFLLVNSSAHGANSSHKWHVPLSFTTSAAPNIETQIWMRDPLSLRASDINFEIPMNVSWIKANVNASGYYRVNYEPAIWQALIRVLANQPTTFSPADRAQLIDDAFTLAWAGMLNVTVPLTLSQYLVNETDYLPWSTALTHLRKLDTVLSIRTARRSLHCFVRHLVTPLYSIMGWTTKVPHIQSLLQREILEAAVYFGLSSAVNEARRLFTQWMSGQMQLPPDIRDIVYSTGIKYGGWTEWDYCWQRYKETTVPDERLNFLRALAASNDPWILQQYLDFAMERNSIRVQDIRTVVESVARNPVGSLLVWRQLQTRWNMIEVTFGRASFTIGRLIVAAVSHFHDPLDLKSVQTFFRNVNVGSGKRSLMQSLELIQANINFLSKNDRQLEQWLSRNSPRC